MMPPTDSNTSITNQHLQRRVATFSRLRSYSLGRKPKRSLTGLTPVWRPIPPRLLIPPEQSSKRGNAGRDDRLVGRGANPRTGLVSPITKGPLLTDSGLVTTRSQNLQSQNRGEMQTWQQSDSDWDPVDPEPPKRSEIITKSRDSSAETVRRPYYGPGSSVSSKDSSTTIDESRQRQSKPLPSKSEPVLGDNTFIVNRTHSCLTEADKSGLQKVEWYPKSMARSRKMPKYHEEEAIDISLQPDLVPARVVPLPPSRHHSISFASARQDNTTLSKPGMIVPDPQNQGNQTPRSTLLSLKNAQADHGKVWFHELVKRQNVALSVQAPSEDQAFDGNWSTPPISRSQSYDVSRQGSDLQMLVRIPPRRNNEVEHRNCVHNHYHYHNHYYNTSPAPQNHHDQIQYHTSPTEYQQETMVADLGIHHAASQQSPPLRPQPQPLQRPSNSHYDWPDNANISHPPVLSHSQPALLDLDPLRGTSHAEPTGSPPSQTSRTTDRMRQPTHRDNLPPRKRALSPAQRTSTNRITGASSTAHARRRSEGGTACLALPRRRKLRPDLNDEALPPTWRRSPDATVAGVKMRCHSQYGALDQPRREGSRAQTYREKSHECERKGSGDVRWMKIGETTSREEMVRKGEGKKEREGKDREKHPLPERMR